MSSAPRASRPNIYPRCCFHLSPTYNVWCLLRAAEIQCLEQHAGFEGQDFYFHKNLPIRWVRIVGVVVAIDEFAGRRVFTIDDSSGVCMETITTYTQPSKNATKATSEILVQKSNIQDDPPYPDIDVGMVVDVKGKLTTFRDEMQIKIEKMILVKGTAQEVTLWEKRDKFRREVLDPPWTLRDKEIRRCRREAERTEEEETRKKRRYKETAERAASTRQPDTSRQTSMKEKDKDKEEAKEKENMSAEFAASLKSIMNNGTKGRYSALGI